MLLLNDTFRELYFEDQLEYHCFVDYDKIFED